MKSVSLRTLHHMKQEGEKSVCLTAYDATFALIAAQAGVDMLLVGDSLGMVVQGHRSTVPVTIDDMCYHTSAVSRGLDHSERRPWLISDMPFMSYATPEQMLNNAAKLAQAGAQMVKVEGGRWLAEGIRKLVERGISVCGHLGLTPQSVDALGGYRVQGRDTHSARQIYEDALELVDAGIAMLVLECVPAKLAADISQKLPVPVIGIGAGPDTDAQVLVLHDMLGVTPNLKPKFVRNFMDGAASIQQAIENYVKAVKNKEFPTEEHSF
ncbi:MAG: 3-methyl-2-oxobutanoate hydroxymethyltransferase [Gammaproteobacteria bacterium]|nr:MAG: 3-methyl-2-oxobutanoate hydroxymethyltransferase [Gammaproteobacteria bacterium]